VNTFRWDKQLDRATLGAQKTILVIDDDVECAAGLLQILNEEGFVAVFASDGNEAWDKIVSESPEVLLVDWNLPGCDGLQLLKKMRSDPAHRDRYAIMVTARMERSDIVAGMEAGADDYLTKPFNNDELLARIRVGLRTRELERELTDQARRTTIREMAGSVAHEIGNPLTAAKLLCQKIEARISATHSPEVEGDLQALTQEIRRIEQLVRRAQSMTHVRTKPYAGGLQIIDLKSPEE
jgi:phosphoserine phosphatase RsbU/P